MGSDFQPSALPQSYALPQFSSHKISQETIDYIFMELHRLRDWDKEQTRIIQHMSQEILQLRQEVTSLTTIVTATLRTLLEMEE